MYHLLVEVFCLHCVAPPQPVKWLSFAHSLRGPVHSSGDGMVAGVVADGNHGNSLTPR